MAKKRKVAKKTVKRSSKTATVKRMKKAVSELTACAIKLGSRGGSATARKRKTSRKKK